MKKRKCFSDLLIPYFHIDKLRDRDYTRRYINYLMTFAVDRFERHVEDWFLDFLSDPENWKTNKIATNKIIVHIREQICQNRELTSTCSLAELDMLAERVSYLSDDHVLALKRPEISKGIEELKSAAQNLDNVFSSSHKPKRVTAAQRRRTIHYLRHQIKMPGIRTRRTIKKVD